jgi:N,N'-diacetylbacillosaminyl-diphospho-undecaprenol alpha-1,3-N-acetylgalactosaminyltransferase
MKIVFLSSLDLNLYLFRIDIMLKFRELGHEIIAIIPEGKYSEKIREKGFKTISYSLERGSLNPFGGLSSILELKTILKNIKPDILHTFTVKPNIYGTIAGKLTGVPIILNLVEGLGSFYADDSLKSKIIRIIIENLYKFIFSYSTKVIFVNSDDPKYLINQKVIEQNRIHVIKSVGIDIYEYNPTAISQERKIEIKNSLGIPENKKIAIMIARAIFHKGTADFYKMGELLRDKGYIFLFVGDIDEGNKWSMSKEFMKRRVVKWLGWRDDIIDLISISDLVVLPSYREGIPRTLLEAMAIGKPIVTTDTVGCRETVNHGENGYLVPVASPKALSEHVDKILSDEVLQKEMGIKSRERAVSEFDIKKIVQQYIELYKKISDKF